MADGDWVGNRRRTTWLFVVLALASFAALGRAGRFSDDNSFVSSLRKADAVDRGDTSVSFFANQPKSSRMVHTRSLQAIKTYRGALPDLGARRRIGLVKYYFLAQVPRSELLIPNSAIRVSPAEATMWGQTFGLATVAGQDIPRIASTIRGYRLGPLEPVALLVLFKNSGDTTAARRQSDRLDRIALLASVRICFLTIIPSALAFCGVAVLLRNRQSIRKVFSRGTRPFRFENTLTSSFLEYLSTWIILSTCTKWLIGHVDLRTYALGAATAPIVGLAVCLQIVARSSSGPGILWRIIGPHGASSLLNGVWTGCKAFAAVLPLALVAAGVSTLVASLLGLHANRFDPFAAVIRQGGGVAGLLVILAIIIAPIVEEVCFRGMLFKGLRGSLGFLSASVLSSTVFACAHGFNQPQAFLQLILLGLVLAYLRDTNRSIVPCVACHALNNCLWVAFALWV